MVTRTGPQYAPWPRRAGAVVIDALPILGIAVLALGLMWLTRIRACDGDTSALDLAAQCGSGISVAGVVAFVAAWLGVVGYGAWNFGYRQGRRGATLGKSAMGLAVVGAESGQPVGVLLALVRLAAQLVNLVSLGLGFLWPLWDNRHQTFADKLVTTVCIRELSSTALP
ncbi:RDD family protein [Mycolicibacterium sp. 624]|uniref:RDD family protein n=1 Tax=Mycolicibacterium sp. 624 TaxID=3156314 RepID=UPI003393C2C1